MSTNKYLDINGLSHFWGIIKGNLDGKVAVEEGKSLVSDELITKLEGIESATHYEGTREGEESDNDVIARVLGETVAVKDDIFIVKALITEGKYSYTAYVYNGEAWVAMDGNYNANNVYFSEDMMVTKEIGYITLSNGQGTIPSAGKNLKEVFEAMFVKESNPTKTDPSVSVTVSKAGTYEVGTVISGATYTVSFEDGKYSYGPEPTGATVSAWEIKDNAGNSYEALSGNLADITVVDGATFSITAKATHTAGAVPVTNKGNACTDSSKQIAAGTKSKTAGNITGYRSYFYGVLDTSTAEAPLTSAIIRDNLTNGGAYDAAKEFTLNGSATAKRIVIVIPSSSTRGGLSEVILTSAMNTPVTDSYVLTEAGVKVEGVGGATAVDYDVYVYEPASIDAGEVHAIKLA